MMNNINSEQYLTPEEMDEEIRKEEQQEARDYWLENGKLKINELLWMLLPGHATLQEADDMACKIYAMIDESWEKRQ